MDKDTLDTIPITNFMRENDLSSNDVTDIETSCERPAV